MKWPPAAWLDEDKLPALHYATGEPLPSLTRRYLLVRQSSMKDIIPSIELKPLYALIERKTSGDFALTLWSHFLAPAPTRKIGGC